MQRRSGSLNVKWLTILAFAVVVLCLQWAAGTSRATADQASPPTVLRLGYFANVTHAQAVLGVASGDFQKALGPTQLQPKVFNAGPSLIEALIAGDIDIGYVGPGPALTAWAETHGQELAVISGAAANGVVIVAGPNSNIHTLADLAGKRIATPQRNNTQDISARHYLRDVLHQASDTNIIPIANPELVGRMLAGDIDAAWVPEPWGSRLVASAGGKIIAEEKDLWPDHEFALTVVIARAEFLHDHPETVAKLLAVHRDWTRRLEQSPKTYSDQLGAALLSLTRAKLPAGVLDASLDHVKFTDDPLPATFDIMARWSLELRVIRQPAKLDGLFDTSILDHLP
jgi:NitT/TauT family transport system substrate-binding protein